MNTESITDKITAILGQHCGLNADWSVMAWCVTEGATPNITPHAFYLIDNEDETWAIIRREQDEDDTRVDIASMNEEEMLEWLGNVAAEREPLPKLPVPTYWKEPEKQPTTFTYDPVERDITDHRNVVIAQMCQFDDDDEIARFGQLLATAPELLDAAETLMDVLRELPRGPQHDAMVNLHYIIAKAKGEL